MKDLRRSLRTRVILFAGLALALVLAIMALQASRVLDATTRELLAEWRDTVQRNAGRLEDEVEGDQFIVGGLADRLAATPTGAAAQSLLWSSLPRLTLFNDGLFWLSPGGQVLAEAPGPVDSTALLPVNLSQALPSIDNAQRMSGMLQTRNGHRVVVYAVSVAGHGTVLAVMDLESRPLDSYLPLPTARGHAAVVDGSGVVLAATQENLLYTQADHQAWVAQVLKQGEPVVQDTGSSGRRQADTLAFAPVGDTGWGLLFGEPTSVALSARVGFIHEALLFGLVADLAVVLYSWWMSGGLTGPLEHLAGVAGRIAGGDLETPIDMDREDEVGALARAFETMRRKLRRSLADLNGLVADTRRREEATAALYAVSQEALHPDNADKALQVVTERTRQLLGGASAAVCLADGPQGPLHVATATYGPASETSELACGAPQICVNGATCPLRGEPGSDRVSAPINGDTPGRLCVLAAPDAQASGEDQRLLEGLASLAALAAARERLQEQSRRLAVYSERERIARDLHDTVSQSLSYLYSQLELLQVLLPTSSTEQLSAELHSLSDVASATFEATRDSIYRLRTPATGPESLPSAIAGCVRDFTARTGITVDQDTDAAAGANLPAETEAQLVRIVQEALANVAKHAGATRVRVTAAADPAAKEMRITVEDNGHGFDPSRPRQGRRSFGLEMMRERAESVGGRLQIQSGPGKGTWVQLRIATQS